MGLVSRNSSEYLDISTVNFVSEAQTKALIVRAKLDKSVIDKPYLRFYFRDVNGKIVSGVFFELDSLPPMQGFGLASMRGKVVKIRYTASNNFSGNISLRVLEFHEVGAEEAVNFVAIYKEAQKTFDSYTTVLKNLGITSKISPIITTTPSYGIGSGLVGGYAEFLYTVFESLIPYLKRETINRKDFLEAADLILEGYRRNKEMENFSTDKLRYEVLSYVMELANLASSGRVKNIVSDAMFCLVSEEPKKAQHLYSHIIVNSIMQTMETYSLLEMYDSVIPGSSMRLGGDRTLAKY